MQAKLDEKKFGQSHFIGLTVSITSEPKKDNSAETNIDIPLGKAIEPEKLPYHEFYDKAYLERIGGHRVNQCIVLARGDITPPEVFFETGSILPNGILKEKFTETERILDVASHRVTSEGSGVLSCTKSVEVAKNFSQSGKEVGGGYVYLVKGTGAISPIQFAAQEKEYSLPGGIDAIDIIGFRQVPPGKFNFSGSTIYLNKDFIAQYPDKAEKTLQTYLEKSESLSQESQKVLQDLVQECRDFLKLKQATEKLLIKGHFQKDKETGLWQLKPDELVKSHGSNNLAQKYQEKHQDLHKLAGALNGMQGSKYEHVEKKEAFIQLIKNVQSSAENYQKSKFSLFKSSIANEAGLLLDEASKMKPR